MSTHYIDLICPAPGCTRSEGIYTGSVLTDYFEAALDYEGATIDARCDEHSNWEAPGVEATTAVERAAEAIRASVIDTPTEKAAPIMAQAGLAAALDVEGIAKVLRDYFDPSGTERNDPYSLASYREAADAIRAALLGGEA